MPFDASALSSADQAGLDYPRTRRGQADALSLGVFQYGGQWKIYSSQGRAAVYPNRDLAVSVAETQALEAVRCGRAVELFVEDETGELRQAAIALN